MAASKAVQSAESSRGGPPHYGMPIPFVFVGPDDEKTFQYEETLPSLPIPPLDQTLTKYLDSVAAILTEEEYQHTEKIVRDFGQGIGRELHSQLLEFAKHKRNWLEKPWEDYAYLMNREPHAPYVNFGGPTPFSMEKWPPKDGSDLERAALVNWLNLTFWDLLRKEKLRIDRGGKTTVWSMYQFHRMFNGCKTPGETMDQLNDYFKTENEGPCPSHVVVMCRGRFFKFNFLDSNGQIITAPEIEHQLRYIQTVCEREPWGPGLGALTADNRTTWYHNRQHLISLSPDNERYLMDIQTSAFIISLDERRPETLNELSREALIGDPKCRWFDKTQVPTTFKNGMVVSNCDHAPHDAMVNVVITFYNYLALDACNYKWQHSPVDGMTNAKREYFVILGLEGCGYQWKGPTEVRAMELPQELKFQIDDRILKAVESAVEVHKKGGDSIEIQVSRFTSFGKDAIRKLNLHPDTFCQLALQYGYYRLHKKPAATYETASTRKYYHGRTDTLRSCTKESHEWTKSMLNPKASNQQRYKLLLAAFEKHNKLMAEAVEGNGIDRHLMGMQLMALSQGLPMPELYTDKAYTLSGGNGNYILSTSCVGYTPVYGGVAPMCKDGYGFFYSIEPHRINVYCASWVADKSTSAPKLLDSVFRSFVDMKNLVQSVTESKL